MFEKKTTFGDAVKQKRTQIQLSQSKLAEKIPCSVETIRAIEQNKKNYIPSPEMRERISKILQINENEIKIDNVRGAASSIQPILVKTQKSQPAKRTWWIFISIISIGLFFILSFYLYILSYTGNVVLYRENPAEDFVIITGSDGRRIKNGDIVKLGELITVSFIVQNHDTRMIIIPWMVMGARGPGVFDYGDKEWDAPEVGFTYQFYVILNLGNIATYQDKRAFFQEGDYFIEPIYADIRGWHGIKPFTRIYFKVEN